MGKVIWKYEVHPKTEISLPKDAQILSVQLQGEGMSSRAYMWVLLDRHAPKIVRTFWAIGTGWEGDDSHMRFIATFQMPHLGLVWHLFEEENKESTS